MSVRHALRSGCVSALALLSAPVIDAQPTPAADVAVGRPITAVIDELRARGLPFAYSTAVLEADLLVERSPQATEPLEVVREILAPHGLTVRSVDGLYLVVRAEPLAAPLGRLVVTVRNAATGRPLVNPGAEELSAGLRVEQLGEGRLALTGVAGRRYAVTVSYPGFEPRRYSTPLSVTAVEGTLDLTPVPAVVPELIVTASRYELLRELLGSPHFIDQRAIQQTPDFGDDPLRALHRLPGTAAGGAGARAHVRGSEEEDTAIVLNGQRLLDPFHIRDYQGLFSAIDTRAIEHIEVYTGGYPVRYGDQIGGLVLIDALAPNEPRHTELGLSLFNTSALSAGTIGDGTGDWLVSARRGNLDRVLNEELGTPTYYDFFGALGVNFSARTRVTANVLAARDRVLLVTESDPTEREQSTNDTQNSSAWVRWEQEWSGVLASSTIFSTSRFRSRRRGSIDDPEKIVAAVDDQRHFSIDSVRQDWTLPLAEEHLLAFGGEFERFAATYDYSGSADYFGFFATFVGVPTAIRRALDVRADGDAASLYVSDRWQVTSGLSADLGLRWDRQGGAGRATRWQLSPRFDLLHKLGERTDLRMSLGRYHQSQGVHELQIEDGVTDYFPAQSADQVIVGLQHSFKQRYALRVEVYRKSLENVRPRYENLLDPLAIIPELEPDRVRVAPEWADARGLEASVAYEGPGPWSAWASYTLARVMDRVANRDVPRSWDQRHALQAGSTWSGPRWTFGAALNVHSGWPTTGVTFDGTNPAALAATFGERNALRLGGFSSLDLRANRRVPLRLGSLDLSFELSNATNRDNPCCGDFDLDEDDNGRFSLEQGTDLWLPRLASFGVLWEF